MLARLFKRNRREKRGLEGGEDKRLKFWLSVLSRFWAKDDFVCISVAFVGDISSHLTKNCLERIGKEAVWDKRLQCWDWPCHPAAGRELKFLVSLSYYKKIIEVSISRDTEKKGTRSAEGRRIGGHSILLAFLFFCHWVRAKGIWDSSTLSRESRHFRESDLATS